MGRKAHQPGRSRVCPHVPAKLAAFIDRLGLRSPLSQEERAALAALDPPVSERRARWDLVRPGERVDYACLVIAGIVGRAEQFADGRRQTTAVHVPGDMADLHSVPVPRAAWAITALTDCTICEVPHGQLRELATRYPAIGAAFWRDTVADASVYSKWISVLSRHDARGRMAHLLCELGLRMEAAGLGRADDFELRLTQDQLSEVLGVTPVHVYRTFRALRDAGVIATERRSIRVLERPALERIAEFDPAYLLLGRD